MDAKAAFEAFQDLLDASQQSQKPHEITLRARPVVDGEHPGETIAVRSRDHLPEGTVSSEPDALALELHVSAPPGSPLGQQVLAVATARGLAVGTSDLLLM